MPILSYPSSPLILTLLLLLLSFPILFIFFLAPSLLPPRRLTITTTDDLDDLSLFQKAISLSQSSTPAKSHHRPSTKSRLGSTSTFRPKIAFLFLTNSDLYFLPLWHLFFNQTHPNLYNIYIHADPSIPITPPTGVFADKIIPSKRTQRSSPTLVSAARRLLATALLHDPANAYFTLTSQHCIPLHSFNHLYKFLFNIRKLQKNLDYLSYIEILSHSPILWDRYNARGENVMTPEVGFDQFRVGSQFFTLSRTHALKVIEDRRLWRKFKLPCINVESCYPEEHYFPTLLSMVDLEGCSKYTLTRVNWTDSVNGHPHTYHPPEVSSELIHRLRESNSSYSYMFARKFSPDCLSPLMEIANSVIFKD
ncbi:hypothetical protein ACH5RR_009620 [Cinchona calisaya]|uniref:Core-2/I-branching beta-1,6-N-acetylglucosaminyltransferase family protein n=1 Tax=Cinchona calisaya TaxID=153742 RepID=A0ABD3AIG8_9GENT